MTQLTCRELADAPFGLEELLLLDSPTDDEGLLLVFQAWYARSAPGGKCYLYMRRPDPLRAICDSWQVSMTEAARDADAVWYELQRSTAADRYDQVAAFTGETRREVLEKCKRGIFRTREAWEAASTDTPAGREAFYRSADAYLYELIEYESPFTIEPPLQPIGGRRFELAHGTGDVLIRGARDSIAMGFDLSEVLREFLRFRVEHYYPQVRDRVLALDRWDDLEPGTFDRVHAYHVLEHLEDPLETLRRLVALLQPEGVIEVIAPFEAVGDEYPEHNPNLAHLTVPGLFGEVGLRVVGEYKVGVWTSYFGVRVR